MNVGINLLRFFLVAINTVFVLLSGGLFAAAIWSDFSYREYFEIVNVKPVLEFLFATSVAIFLISLAGWAAAYKAHRGTVVNILLTYFGNNNFKIIQSFFRFVENLSFSFDRRLRRAASSFDFRSW